LYLIILILWSKDSIPFPLSLLFYGNYCDWSCFFNSSVHNLSPSILLFFWNFLVCVFRRLSYISCELARRLSFISCEVFRGLSFILWTISAFIIYFLIIMLHLFNMRLIIYLMILLIACVLMKYFGGIITTTIADPFRTDMVIGL
jgi:hypothetical protein